MNAAETETEGKLEPFSFSKFPFCCCRSLIRPCTSSLVKIARLPPTDNAPGRRNGSYATQAKPPATRGQAGRAKNGDRERYQDYRFRGTHRNRLARRSRFRFPVRISVPARDSRPAAGFLRRNFKFVPVAPSVSMAMGSKEPRHGKLHSTRQTFPDSRRARPLSAPSFPDDRLDARLPGRSRLAGALLLGRFLYSLAIAVADRRGRRLLALSGRPGPAPPNRPSRRRPGYRTKPSGASRPAAHGPGHRTGHSDRRLQLPAKTSNPGGARKKSSHAMGPTQRRTPVIRPSPSPRQHLRVLSRRRGAGERPTIFGAPEIHGSRDRPTRQHHHRTRQQRHRHRYVRGRSAGLGRTGLDPVRRTDPPRSAPTQSGGSRIRQQPEFGKFRHPLSRQIRRQTDRGLPVGSFRLSRISPLRRDFGLSRLHRLAGSHHQGHSTRHRPGRHPTDLQLVNEQD